MKSHCEKLHNGIQWWILLKMWLIGSRVSRWAGRKMIDLSSEANKKDILKKANESKEAF
jgi:hypothetical protein